MIGPEAVEFHPKLVEDAVWEDLLRRPGPARLYHAERARLYDLEGDEARDLAFGALHRRWFERLGLGAAVVRALREEAPARGLRRVVLHAAPRTRDEGSELFVKAGEATLAVRLHPATLADAAAARALLRRELRHASDMLDEEFGYAPRLPRSVLGPARDRLVQDRYRALWRTTVDGRLAREEVLPRSCRDDRLRDLGRAFACLGAGEIEALCDRLFDGARPRHEALLALALDPRPASAAGPATPAHRCALCGCPAPDLGPCPVPGLSGGSAAGLPAAGEAADLAAAIRADFPDWSPDCAVCRQCADLYAARLETGAAPRIGPTGAPDAAGTFPRTGS